MPSTGTLGGTLPSEPKSLKAKSHDFPHDGSTGLKLPTLASPSVTDNHHGAGAKGATGLAGRSKNLLVDTGATYSVLTSYSGAFSSQTCTILGAIGKQLQKYSPKHFFVAGMDKYFPTNFWWSLRVLLPYWEETFPRLDKRDTRCLITFPWGQAIFTSYQVKQPLNGRGHLWMLIKGSSDIKQC